MTAIGEEAFGECLALESIEITIGDQTITFAGNDLAKLMSKSTSSEALSTFGAALYLYGKAAEACFQTVTD